MFRFASFWRVWALLMLGLGSFQSVRAADQPNFVVLFADDLGYGDLGCYGHPTIRTPHLDRMAAEGVRFTQFYSAAPVCTPSRAGLLTGRLPVRSGMCSDKRRVLFPDSAGGIPAREVTLAEGLKAKGYATAAVGKWHLGHLPQYLPTRNGFDYYWGIPYSNDMDRVADRKLGRGIFWDPKSEYWNVPIMRNEQVVERPADQTTITKRYTDEAVRFIQRHKHVPFFLYLAHSMPHVPLFASTDFKGKSPRGLYGDVIEEVDWSVGQILETLRKEGLSERTLVFFTSDNGPWLIFDTHGGSAGLLREGKGSTWEGGMREPGIAWWPGRVPGGRTVTDLASTMDIYTTCLTLAGAEVPKDRVVDGVDLSPVLFGKGKGKRDTYFYYRGEQLYAARKGAFKAHYITQGAYDGTQPEKHDPPVLYNLEHDPSEKYDIAKEHPEVLKAIAAAVKQHRDKLVRGENMLESRIPTQASTEWKDLFDGKSIKGWKQPDFAGGGEVVVEDGLLKIYMGETLAGLAWTNNLPRVNYELEVEAMKLDGSDFFCGLTFPYKDRHCTLVLGGWGGAVTGISSIDNFDASDNDTTDFIRFDKNKWYQVKVKVTPDRIQCWLDGDSIVNLETEGRDISMRPGDIELCMPLGIANYQTSTAVRKIRLRQIEGK